jgi:hypothetical protein
MTVASLFPCQAKRGHRMVTGLRNPARRVWAVAVVLLLLLAYLALYLILSRQGFALSEAVGAKGFYFCFPVEDTKSWRIRNRTCVLFFCPLIVVDNWVGTGEPVAGEPLFHLSGRSEKGKTETH